MPDEDRLVLTRGPNPTEIPERFHFSRDALSGDEAKELAKLSDPTARFDFLSQRPLSDIGRQMMSADTKDSEAKLRARESQESDLHSFLITAVPDTAWSTIRAHTDYDAYNDAPLQSQGYTFFLLLEMIHSKGSGAAMVTRTKTTLALTQGDDAYPIYADKINRGFDQLDLDYGVKGHPGHLNGECLKSAVLLNGINHSVFRSCFDAQVAAHAGNNFANCGALMTAFSDFNTTHVNNSFEQDVSVQGAAFVAAEASVSPSDDLVAAAAISAAADAAAKKKRGKPCSHCLRDLNKHHYGHSAKACSRNPANRKDLPRPAAPPPPPFPAYAAYPSPPAGSQYQQYLPSPPPINASLPPAMDAATYEAYQRYWQDSLDSQN